jgi:hypothetical protein
MYIPNALNLLDLHPDPGRRITLHTNSDIETTI